MSINSIPILNERDLVLPFEESCRPRGSSRVGVEFEHLGLDAVTGRAVPYSGERGVEAVLKFLAEGKGWIEESAGGTRYLHRPGGGTVSLEPGGQVELSTEVALSFDAVRDARERFLEELREAGKRFGILWAGLGVHPLASVDEVPWIPKERYQIMREYFVGRGPLAHSMMKRTASIQVSLDYASEEEAAEKMRLAMKSAPLFVALFANSPVADGKLVGFCCPNCPGEFWANPEAFRAKLP